MRGDKLREKRFHLPSSFIKVSRMLCAEVFLRLIKFSFNFSLKFLEHWNPIKVSSWLFVCFWRYCSDNSFPLRKNTFVCDEGKKSVENYNGCYSCFHKTRRMCWWKIIVFYGCWLRKSLRNFLAYDCGCILVGKPPPTTSIELFKYAQKSPSACVCVGWRKLFCA